jgi:hypothetical protein
MIIIVYYITNYYNLKKLKSCSIEYKIKSDIDPIEPEDIPQTIEEDDDEEEERERPLFSRGSQTNDFLRFFMFS